MATIPTDRAPDSTLAFLRAGYRFVGQRCDRYGTDIFQTRLLLEPTICLRGRAATELFYDADRFMREGAMPARGQRTLTGRGGVQGLDGDAHHDRKAMFMSLMSPAAVRRLGQLFADEWQARLPAWELSGTVTLHTEVASMLTRAVCAWAGVPLSGGELDRRTADLQAMIDSAAAIGPRHWRGRLGRYRSEYWGADLVEQVRHGKLSPPEGTALRVIAEHRDGEGRRLPRRIAAVELLNVLRPTIAVARFVVFAALALHDHPAWRQRVRDDDAEAGSSCRRCAATTRSSRWRGPGPAGLRLAGLPLPAGPTGAAGSLRHQSSPRGVAGAGAVPAGALRRLAG